MKKILSVPDNERNWAWEEHFFKEFVRASVHLLHEAPQQGPDGWPYLLVQTTESSTETEEQEPVQKILDWLSSRGIGLAVNPTNKYPDYVFSYGMIWHFKETGLFLRPSEGGSTANSEKIELNEGQKIHAGEPTEQYLPLYARKILRDFFQQQGIPEPKVLLMSTDEKNYDLIFSIESLKSPPEIEHPGIAEAISWFLPPHYSIAIMSEKGLPPFFVL